MGAADRRKSLMRNTCINHENYAILSSFLLLPPTLVHQISNCDTHLVSHAEINVP
jgi:hypothetical protein